MKINIKKVVVALTGIIISIFFVVVFIGEGGGVRECDLYLETKTISLGEQNFEVEVADYDKARYCGLSFKEGLEDSDGMLFVFENSDFHGIWMREMLFPIDIIWLDENYRIINLKIGASPDSYPEIFTPKSPARFVIEVREGVILTVDISIGDYAIIELQGSPL